MKKLFVVTRGGIGDHFICTGIVNHLSETSIVNLACWQQWLPTLQSLYIDNPNVILHPVQDKLLGHFHDRNMKKQADNLESDYIGLALHTMDMKNYMRIPYNETKLSFEYMYTKFNLSKKVLDNQEFIDKIKPKNPYVLINIWDKVGNKHMPNFQIENVNPDLEKLYLTPGKTKNLLDWASIILGAEEIHSIAGGPCHLIDIIYNGKLFYHDARIQSIFNINNEFNNDKWQKIKYMSKRVQ
ncbi:MAG: hypothetical protein EBT86_05965 [Actinobacteria bacterium]|nr:hypothetical protein [Actinomycetota bacterium]